MFHTIAIAIDWSSDAVTEETLPNIVTLRIGLCLIIIGALIGFTCQGLALIGGRFERRGFILFGPMIAGICFGACQGYLVETDLWGYATAGIPLRPLAVRIIAGGFMGFVVVPAMMVSSAFIRNARRQ